MLYGEETNGAKVRARDQLEGYYCGDPGKS